MIENADNPAQDAPYRATSRWVWVLLVGSLAVNFLIIGAIGGHLWAHRHDDGSRNFGRSGERQSFFRKLPVERKNIIRQTLREHREKTRPLWQKVKETRQQARQILETEPFDEEKFLISLDQLQTAETEARAASRPMMVEIIKQLEPNERKHFLRIYSRRILSSRTDKRYRKRQEE